MTELAVVLLKDIMVPALKAVAGFLKDDVVPFIRDWTPALKIVLQDIGKTLREFFGPRFKQYIQPITDFFNDAAEFVSGTAGKVVDFFGSFFGDDKPKGPNLPIPQKADGAAMVNTPVIAGEAGPEMILPLKAATVERVLAPLLPKLEVPGIEALARASSETNRLLQGTLRVAMDGGGFGAARDDGRSALDAAPGVAGIGGW